MFYERNMYLLTKMFLLNQNVLSLSITKKWNINNNNSVIKYTPR